MVREHKVLAIVGPTAVGKSSLALRLALELGGEVVSADSRQVYRYMDIGTAKPSPEKRAAVPHHLIDVVDPDGQYSLALFLRQARSAINEVRSRSKLPIVAGGSGQYVWGLLEGWQVPEVPPDAGLRRSLEERAREEGAPALHAELAALDPDAAGRTDARNARRVVRALEVYHSSAGSLVSPARRQAPPFATVTIGLSLERAALYRRVDERVDAMVEAGWVGEVRELLGRGYDVELPSMSSLGYAELARHLGGEMPLDEAVGRTKRRTHRFVRHQYSWFKPRDDRIRWFEGTAAGLDEAAEQAARLLDRG